MGAIKVHEFTTLDGSVGVPTWTVDLPWTDAQTRDTEALTAEASAILLVADDVRDVRARVVAAHGRGRPGRTQVRACHLAQNAAFDRKVCAKLFEDAFGKCLGLFFRGRLELARTFEKRARA